MKRHLVPLYLGLAIASGPGQVRIGAAQAPRMAFAPPAAGIKSTLNVEYGAAGPTKLAMDIYQPLMAAGQRAPALIFFNRATGAERSGPFYSAWARAAASNGIIGILPDLRGGSEADDFRTLLAYLERRGAEHGIESIAVYAGSGNVYAALPVVEDPKLTAIKAAVMYYGVGNVSEFRLDLPLLYVRAGLDRPLVNRSIAALGALAMTQNAPLTMLNYAGGHHAFEMVDDTDATREVIERTLAFVKAASASSYHASLRASLPEATAAGLSATGKFHEAAEAYRGMAASHPEDLRVRLAYGEALLGDKQYAAACAEFDKLRDKDLGYRDRGLPAAEACLLSGDPAAAVAWLRTIPPQFLPPSIAQEPRFAPLRERPDFQALFKR